MKGRSKKDKYKKVQGYTRPKSSPNLRTPKARPGRGSCIHLDLFTMSECGGESQITKSGRKCSIKLIDSTSIEFRIPIVSSELEFIECQLKLDVMSNLNIPLTLFARDKGIMCHDNGNEDYEEAT